ncbi:fimbrial protein [Pseudomonas putida]|uniref:fimbrial protein n=1 Tax=Pseudomonas putida TaxID=303 RepID=UPI0026599AC7|nr:fimbrial protein [Pseudomonas putida]MCZ9636569.1 type 1 fimbrial protein [Pseudomonas putida]
MKKFLCGIGICLASGSALANTGSINFYGKVDSSTCPIEIVDPDTGAISNRLDMGTVFPYQFAKGVGSEAASRSFGLRIDPTKCAVSPAKSAYITFNSRYGATGLGNADYGLKPGTDSATGLGLRIRDYNHSVVGHGQESTGYPLSDTAITTIGFNATYIATAATVGPGPAETDIEFVVDIR